MTLSQHPNPAFEREDFVSLNGAWDFCFDYKNKFEKTLEIPFDRVINVPFCYHSKESGINENIMCENIWYRRSFSYDGKKKKVLLKVGACDNTAKVYINKKFVFSHSGGFIPFEVDITNYITAGDNEIIIKAEDSLSRHLVRGKQSWREENVLCWYKNTVGIWQNVWLEFAGENYITSIFATPDVDSNSASFEVNLSNVGENQKLSIELFLNGEKIAQKTESVFADKVFFGHTFKEYGAEAVIALLWSENSPNLIDIKLTLFEGDDAIDKVKSYFGMRKISINKNRIYLNDQPLYQQLILAQGYYADGMMTPKNLEEIEKDILLIKEMGFNGVRMHQKIDDPRFYYLADKHGLLVWGELPSAYEYSFESRQDLINTMTGFIKRDYNHPCIINWVTINESWGLHRITGNSQQQNFARALYYMVKAIDKTRLVSSNDGWEQIEENDICGIHDYTLTTEDAEKKLEDLDFILEGNAQFKAVYAESIHYNNKPILITEYGGIKMAEDEGWGYDAAAQSEAEFIERLTKITAGIKKNKRICGYCYTQFTDVFHETNGLVDINRKLKADIKQIRKVFSGN